MTGALFSRECTQPLWLGTPGEAIASGTLVVSKTRYRHEKETLLKVQHYDGVTEQFPVFEWQLRMKLAPQ